MPAKSNVPLTKHTLNLRHGDMEKLREALPDLPPAVVVRVTVSQVVDKIEAAHRMAAQQNVEVNLNEIVEVSTQAD